MIKQVIMPILVIEEPGMTRSDNRPYFQKYSTYDCLTTKLCCANEAKHSLHPNERLVMQLNVNLVIC